MKKYYSCFVIFLLSGNWLAARLPGGLTYDFASRAAQQGDWEQAEKLLSSLLVDSPDRADLLYDLGVASCQNADLHKAATYLSHAAACEGSDDSLREKAHFNAGNVQVALHELEKAIAEYEKVLAINNDNEFAQHNLEKVKEMLKQQQEQEQKEQEQQKEKEDKQQQDQQKEEKDRQDKQDNEEKQEEKTDDGQEKDEQQEQNQQENQSDDGQSGDNQSGNDAANDNQNEKSSQEKKNRDGQEQTDAADNNSPNESSQDCDKQDEQRQQAERGANSEQREQDRGQQNRRDERNGANDKDQGDRNDETNDKPKEQPQDQQQNNTKNHNSTPLQKKRPSSDTHSQNKYQGQEKQDIMPKQQKSSNTTDQTDPSTLNPQDQWVTAILEKQAKKDKQTIKKIMGVQIQKECAGSHGQNCW